MVIVTSSYSGIGHETAGVLRAAGAQVIVPARDRARASAALAGLDGIGGVSCEKCDIATLLLETMTAQGLSDAIRRTGSPSLGVMPHAVDPEAAERLWGPSERQLELKA